MAIVDLEQHLNEIEEYGKALTPPAEMAALLGYDEASLSEYLTNRMSPVRKAYMRGIAETAGKLRKQLLEAAAAGSPSAIEQSMNALRNCMIG